MSIADAVMTEVLEYLFDYIDSLTIVDPVSVSINTFYNMFEHFVLCLEAFKVNNTLNNSNMLAFIKSDKFNHVIDALCGHSNVKVQLQGKYYASLF